MMTALLPVAVALCVLLFGLPGWRIFLVSLLVVPVVLLAGWGIARIDRLRLDDARRVFRRTLKKPLPYDELELVRTVETGGLVQAVARTRRGRVEILMFGLAPGEQERFVKAVAARCPGISFQAGRFAGWKLSALVVALLAAVYAGGVFYYQRNSPTASAACESVPAAGDGPARFISRTVNGLSIRLPAAFAGAPLTVIRSGGFRSIGGTGRLFLTVSGIGSEHELLRYAACSRIGIVPLVLKSVLLSRWEEPRVWTRSGGRTQALLIQGHHEGRSELRLMVHNQEAGIEAVIALREPDGITTAERRELVAACAVEAARREQESR